jgi:hypothetical protein
MLQGETKHQCLKTETTEGLGDHRLSISQLLFEVAYSEGQNDSTFSLKILIGSVILELATLHS